jgi:hypothetical protein
MQYEKLATEGRSIASILLVPPTNGSLAKAKSMNSDLQTGRNKEWNDDPDAAIRKPFLALRKRKSMPFRTHPINRRSLLAHAPLALFLGTSIASGEERIHQLFPKSLHDFGNVGRNTKAEFAFEFHNPYRQPIHIVSVRSSCGCTTPSVPRKTIPPGETGVILAQFNTRSFIGTKSANITVVFDQPHFAEVQLTVMGNIRSDISTEPGEIRFGDVPVGESREVTVSILHSGSPDWAITDVRGTSSHLEVRLGKAHRSGSQVQIPLKVRLKEDAVAGDILDELWIVTNRGKADSFSLPVSARIRPPVTATPDFISLGIVQPGAQVMQRLAVRGAKPFSVAKIECDDPRFQFQLPEGERPLHLIQFTFQGEGTPGEVRQKVKIHTSLGDAYVAEATVGGVLR